MRYIAFWAQLELITDIQNIIGFGKPWGMETCAWMTKEYMIFSSNEIIQIFICIINPRICLNMALKTVVNQYIKDIGKI